MISIKQEIGTPKYKQIISSIEEAIVSGKLKKGDKLPSINRIKNELNLSRDTVLMAFNELRNRGVIQSVVGKGYYLTSEAIHVKQKVFLLFDELNAFKEDLYNSFLECLEEHIDVDIYFHHFNPELFDNLIREHSGNYTRYVIMPANLKQAAKAIETLPEDRVYILDQLHDDLRHYPAIYQNFEQAIYDNLNQIINQIRKYKTLVLVFSKTKQPQGIKTGFTRFCKKNKLPFRVIDNVANHTIERGHLYITLEDKSLLIILKSMKAQNFVLTKDIGIVSFNDTLLKEIVEGGITTISTDFKKMGQELANMINHKLTSQIENHNHLIIRNSL